MITFHDLRHVPADVAGAWIDHIAANMRQSDIEEVEASSGLDPRESLRVSVASSSHAWVITHQYGGAISIFGVAPHPLPGIGIVWMLGTDEMLSQAVPIARATRRYLDEMNAAYPLIWNYIDARNKVSMKWLKWGGFELLGDHYFGPHKFHTFARTSHV